MFGGAMCILMDCTVLVCIAYLDFCRHSLVVPVLGNRIPIIREEMWEISVPVTFSGSNVTSSCDSS